MVVQSACARNTRGRRARVHQRSLARQRGSRHDCVVICGGPIGRDGPNRRWRVHSIRTGQKCEQVNLYSDSEGIRTNFMYSSPDVATLVCFLHR
jgi:hypothetical protein